VKTTIEGSFRFLSHDASVEYSWRTSKYANRCRVPYHAQCMFEIQRNKCCCKKTCFLS
jgi:hypothetical protein